MAYFPEEVVAHILGYVSSHQDRNSASLVCRAWYNIERLGRRSVLVRNCYAVRPERVNVRFPSMRSLTLKGQPHFANFNLGPGGWGAAVEPWVVECARACPGLEELRLKRMFVTDDCLKLVACSFVNFKALGLVRCEGFTTAGLATIVSNCRFLRELNLQESKVENRGHQWLNCFPGTPTSLESLNFSCLAGDVNTLALENLVARSPNLKSLRLNRTVPFDVLARILSHTPKLEDLGTGSFVQGNNVGAFSLFCALRKCSLLKSLSGFWDTRGLLHRTIYAVYRNLTTLNLSYAPLIQSADLITVICQCVKLQSLWVLGNIGDVGLKSVSSCCVELQELRVFAACTVGQAGSAVTEEGLVAISSGCRKLNSVFYICKRMTNAALITIAKNSPQLTSFRLCIMQPKSADAVTGQPLDEGFGAIVQSCKDLRRFHMSGLLTDNAFLYVGMYGEKLERLSVAFAGDTDSGMTYVLNGCKNLKNLEINRCPFGDAALLAGVDRYESMRSLWMSACNVTLGGCKSVAASMPYLNVEVMNTFAPSAYEADDEGANNAKVERLYLYRTLAGPRSDAPAFISLL